MQQIAPCLMFVGEQTGRAEEAMNHYVSLFDDARVLSVSRFQEGEPGTGIKHARFELAGRELVAMDGGQAHQFTFTPAVSLFVDLDTEEELDRVFAGLSEGATILMPLQAYPFAARFVWLNDRYGVSWQLRVAPADG